MSCKIENYYTQNGILLKDGDESAQKEACKAKEIATSLIGSKPKIKEQIIPPAHSQNSTNIVIIDPFHNDSWFWFNMYMLSSTQSHFNPPMHSGGGCGSCSCSGMDGEAGLVILLVLAIVALVAAIFAILGFTIYQGIDADEVRKKINEIKQLKKEAQIDTIQDVYDKMLPLLKEEYTDKSLKTSFTATIGVGFGLLTASACLALYAVLNQMPFSSLTTYLAIGGGSVAAAGILAHCFRPIINSSRERKRLKQYQTLFEHVQKLKPLLMHPHQVLTEMQKEKSYIVVNNIIFTKEGEQFNRYENTEQKRLELGKQNYVYLEIENRG